MSKKLLFIFTFVLLTATSVLAQDFSPEELAITPTILLENYAWLIPWIIGFCLAALSLQKALVRWRPRPKKSIEAGLSGRNRK
jgi:hypothetical protein